MPGIGATERSPGRRAGRAEALSGRRNASAGASADAREDGRERLLTGRIGLVQPTLIAEGLANAEIAERLAISEKTVRNQVSKLFDKLGVWTRAQAMVFARDRGFRR